MVETEPLIDSAIDEKWRVWLALAGSGDERDHRNAQRFALIHAFGDETKFHFDAEFHARVCLAENMLMVLAECAESGAPSSQNMAALDIPVLMQYIDPHGY